MQDLAELERRITQALKRIEAGLEGASSAQPVASDNAEFARLRAELLAERESNADLRAKLDAGAAGQGQGAAVAALKRQLDAQGLELQRVKRTVSSLRESLRSLRRAVDEQVVDAELINRAMEAELEAIRTARFAEMAELDEIIAELDPLIAEAAHG